MSPVASLVFGRGTSGGVVAGGRFEGLPLGAFMVCSSKLTSAYSTLHDKANIMHN